MSPPASPLLFVVGMMRSGTSAVTGAMVAMGLGTDADAETGGGNYFNPRGYFESEMLADYCNSFLYSMGGSWYAPPEVTDEVTDSPLGQALVLAGRQALRDALPESPAVWKDPKSTSTLPLWRKAVDRPLGAVLVWRNPVEVALSLWGAIRVDVPLGMALWAEYNLRALQYTDGLPLFVCSYEHVLSDPASFPLGVGRLLEILGDRSFLEQERQAAAAAFFEGSLRRQSSLPAGHEWAKLARSLEDVTSALAAADGIHPSFVPGSLPLLPPWACDEIDEMRALAIQTRESLHRGRAGRANYEREPRRVLAESPENLASYAVFSTAWPIVADRGLAAADRGLAAAGQDLATADRGLAAAGQDLAAAGRNSSGAIAGNGPLVSIVAASWRPVPQLFLRFLASAVSQTWIATELCLCDDASGDASTQSKVAVAEKLDRVRLVTHESSQNAAAAAHTAYGLAHGEFVAFAGVMDVLRPDAVERIADAIAAHPEADVVYSDEDKVDDRGATFSPDLKPDWSPDLLLSEPYLGHLLVIRRSLLEEVGGLGNSYPDDEGYDLMLRATERARDVVHVPDLLYHWAWASIPDSWCPSRVPWAHRAIRRSLEAALERRDVEARIETGPVAGTFHLRWPVPADATVSVVILVHRHVSGTAAGVGTALRRCISAIGRSAGEHLARIVVAVPADLRGQLSRDLDRLEASGAVACVSEGTESGTAEGWSSLYRAANAAARAAGDIAAADAAAPAAGEHHLCFVHGDVSPEPGWLDALLEQSCRTGAGAVGARLVTTDGEIQHSGVALTGDGAQWCSGALDGSIPSSIRWAGLVHECSAVSSACLMTPAAAFAESGGFDAETGAFADVDYCLRLRESGRRVVSTPLAELVHHGTASEGLVATSGGGASPVPDRLRKPDPYVHAGLDLSDPTLSTVKDAGLLGFRLESGGGGVRLVRE